MASLELPLGSDWIRSVLPHRYPMLLVDRVIELEPKRRIVAIKNVSHNEPFFAGHFPDYPIMPGVLVVEALAQAAGLLILSDLDRPEGALFVFAGIERARFRRPVVPGDQLRLEIDLLRLRHSSSRFDGKAFVGDQLVAEATCLSAMIQRS